MRNRLLHIIILLSINVLGFSQAVDSTFVTFTNFHFDSIFLNATRVIDTSTFHSPTFEVLDKEPTLYSTLSNTGLAHKSMRFSNLRDTGFDMSLPSLAAYLNNERNIVSYQSVLPYSELRYVMTLSDKEQHLDFRFGRQFLPRLFASFGIKADMSPGVFKNNRSAHLGFWMNAHYFTEDQRYAILAYAFRKSLELEENGGLANDNAYIEHNETDPSVFTTNLSNATNYVKTSGLGFEHYFNLLPLKKQVKLDQPQDSLSQDSIQDSLFIDSLPIGPTTEKRKFTLGRICHEFSFKYNQLYYNESSPSVAFYQPYDTLLSPSKTYDTTVVRAIRNTLKWSSLGYQKYSDDIPFYLYAGLTHGFYRVKYFNYLEHETLPSSNYQQLSVNGGIIINLFRSTRITGHANLVTLGYQIGDFNLHGQWKQFLGTTSKNWGFATFDAEIKRQSANWFEERYSSNHFRWDNDFNASTYLTFDLKYNFRQYSVGVKQTSIAQYIYFGTDARPTQYDGMFSIREAYFSFHQTLRRFELEGFACVQKASNEEVMHLPLALGRLQVSYSQPLFHKAATLQPMVTVSYFTKYHADAYMPATRTFFLQNDVEIGNFPFIDLAIALKVQKANVFVSYSNMMLLTGNYDSFIAPHYPMRESRIFLGINWRLFN
jgi:hypothetical protein